MPLPRTQTSVDVLMYNILAYLRHLKAVKGGGCRTSASLARGYLMEVKAALSLDPKGPPHFDPALVEASGPPPC